MKKRDRWELMQERQELMQQQHQQMQQQHQELQQMHRQMQQMQQEMLQQIFLLAGTLDSVVDWLRLTPCPGEAQRTRSADTRPRRIEGGELTAVQIGNKHLSSTHRIFHCRGLWWCVCCGASSRGLMAKTLAKQCTGRLSATAESNLRRLARGRPPRGGWPDEETWLRKVAATVNLAPKSGGSEQQKAEGLYAAAELSGPATAEFTGVGA